MELKIIPTSSREYQNGREGRSVWWIGNKDFSPLHFPANQEVVNLWRDTVQSNDVWHRKCGTVPLIVISDSGKNHRIVGLPTGTSKGMREIFLTRLNTCVQTMMVQPL